MYTNRIDTAGNPIYEEVYRMGQKDNIKATTTTISGFAKNEFICVEAPEFVEPIEYFKHLEEPITTYARDY